MIILFWCIPVQFQDGAPYIEKIASTQCVHIFVLFLDWMSILRDICAIYPMNIRWRRNILDRSVLLEWMWIS